MERRPHMLAVPFPAQGHVKALLQLCYKLVDAGIKVTFVNTDFVHSKIIASISEVEREDSGIALASIPDGIEKESDRADLLILHETIRTVMPDHLTDLIQKTNNSENDEPITHVIADLTVGWILDVVEKVGVQQFGFWPSEPGCLQKREDEEGGDAVKSLRNLLPRGTSPTSQESRLKAFSQIGETIGRTFKRVDWVLCNTFYELNPSACDIIPKVLPVGPLLTSCHPKNHATSGSLVPEDTSCLNWLDKQHPGSVIYVSFGSIATVSQHQLNEIALGLELSDWPFLWVVRSGLANGLPVVYPDGFRERVANRGKIVEWAPQEKVLAHPAVASFLTHCGWNSVLEGLNFGVPFLCWPYYADQFLYQYYICDVWKVGLNLDCDENSISSREEIRSKLAMLHSDGTMKANALKFKDLSLQSVSTGGSSVMNFEKFINLLKS